MNRRTYIVALVALALVWTGLAPAAPVQAGLMADYVKNAAGQYLQVSGYNTARGSNQLIVYTPDYPSPTTGNNAFGIEIVVRNSIVTEIRDGKANGSLSNAAIPSDGYVLSGHGTSPSSPYMWLKDNIALGEQVTIERDQILNPEYEVEGVLSKRNPAAPFAFPGGRGSGELVYYDAAYGYPTTGTNEFGYEIVVSDGIVVSVGGNDSAIPVDGFVLSGHGASKTYLQQAMVGAEALVDGMQVTIRVTPQSYLEAAALRISEAEQRLGIALSEYRDIPADQAQTQIDDAHTLLAAAQASYAQQQWTETAVTAQQAQDKALMAIYSTMESSVVDGRAVWYRANEDSPQQVAATMERIQAAGINTLFLETVYRGYAIYPGSPSFQQNPAFVGWDPLQAFVTEGARLGIEVHAWVHTFYVGYEGEDSLYPRGPVLAAHPGWTALDRNLQARTTLESNHYYVSPGNPAVQDFLADGFLDLTDRYAVQGLQLDYIRYPVSSTAAVPYEMGYSYDQVSRNRVQQQLGFDPLTITPDDDPLQWAQWVNWRQDQVTTFVERIADELPAGMLLSTAVFPEEEVAETKFQNWALWAQQGRLDLIAPMVYKTDALAVVASASQFLAQMNGDTLLYVGLGPYLEGFDPYLLARQVDAVNRIGAAGSASFSLNTISQSYLDGLRAGPYRSDASPPHRPEAVALLAQDVIRKIDDIYLPGAGLSLVDADELKLSLQRILAATPGGGAGGPNTAIAQEIAWAQDYLDQHQGGMDAQVYLRLMESFEALAEL